MNPFKELREKSGMNLTQFSAHFGIPYRTLQHWEHGTRKCPDYLLKLMEYKLDQKTPGNCYMCKIIRHIHIFDDQMDCFITDQMEHCPHCGAKIDK